MAHDQFDPVFIEPSSYDASLAFYRDGLGWQVLFAWGRDGEPRGACRDPSVHGGLSKAVYAYPAEHYAFWQTVRAQAGVGGWNHVLPHGAVGQNLMIEGLAEDHLWTGDRVRLPGCVLVVSEPQ
ncbi:MAG TPA: MOSC domain-containing protein [Burkholderiaceae bacterium]|nr:MOSC domain-containing protein [Burkholderiaceae bacterium]